MHNTLNQPQKDVSLMKHDTMMSGAETILHTLVAEGVEILFGYPGGAVIPLYDALYDFKGKLKHILVRHEQGAIHAAQGYARASGQVGVVFATSGPGATNLVTGLADALMDSTSVVCITGQVYAHLLGTDAFQEADVMNVTTAVTKWNCQVKDAADLATVLAKAFYIAKSGRPGPVLIDITKDALLQQIAAPAYVPCTSLKTYQLPSAVDEQKITDAINLINNARRPFVVFGQGVLSGNATAEFKNFIERGHLPAACTLLGLSALSSTHELHMGLLGMHGHYAPNIQTNECDLLIAIGMRFDDRVTGILDQYARQAKVIHIDIDRSELNKNVTAVIGLWGDCKVVLPLLTEGLKYQDRQDWIRDFEKAKEKEWVHVGEKELFPATTAITMAEVVHRINERTQREAILVTDVGQHQMVACRYGQFNKPYSNITSGGLGTMGFALPAAIGAKLAAPERTVIAIAGDGGFQMTLQELGTVMQYHVGIKILILNNEHLGMVRQWQELFHDQRYSSVQLSNPDFVAVAQGYRIASACVSTRDQLQDALDIMFHHEGPYLLEVRVQREHNVFPMVPQGCNVSEIRLY